jgi:hypothetical protein
MLVTCPCNHCGGRIQFAEEDFRELGMGPNGPTGQTISCPHCGVKTTLFIPRKAPLIQAGQQGEPVEANKLRKRQFYFIGLLLAGAGAAVAVIGAMGFAVTAKAAFFHSGAAGSHGLEATLAPIYSLATFLCITVTGVGLCATGKWLMWKVVCSNCGNALADKESALCPCCGAILVK